LIAAFERAKRLTAALRHRVATEVVGLVARSIAVDRLNVGALRLGVDEEGQRILLRGARPLELFVELLPRDLKARVVGAAEPGRNDRETDEDLERARHRVRA